MIRPFTLAVPEAELDDLKTRIDLTRWPEKEPVDDWSQGTPLAALQDLVSYWRSSYDWRACEARLNALGQFITEIDGLDFHFGQAQGHRLGGGKDRPGLGPADGAAGL